MVRLQWSIISNLPGKWPTASIFEPRPNCTQASKLHRTCGMSQNRPAKITSGTVTCFIIKPPLFGALNLGDASVHAAWLTGFLVKFVEDMFFGKPWKTGRAIHRYFSGKVQNSSESLPETNSSPLKITPWKGYSYCKPPFLLAKLVSGRVNREELFLPGTYFCRSKVVT